MSVFPPGETNSNVPPWATASRPEQPANSVTNSAPAIASLRMIKRPPVGSTRHRPGDRRRRPEWSPRRARIPAAAGHARAAYRSRAVVASTLAESTADAHHLVAGAPGACLVRRGRHPVGAAGRAHPTDGVNGLQLPPEPRVAPGAVARLTRRPSKKLADSIRSGSLSTGRPCSAAMGAAYSSWRAAAARRSPRRCRGRPARWLLLPPAPCRSRRRQQPGSRP